MMIELSIVIPVYNVKAYLSRCLDSVLHQVRENWEIIVIDDGSTDGSSDICDDYAMSNDMIRVYHKKNGGLSSARNCGIDHASGSYILFVDSDDFVIENSLSGLVNDAINGEYDIVIGKSYTYYSDKRFSPVVDYNMQASEWRGVEFLNYASMNYKHMTFCAQFCLYNRDFIEKSHYRFAEGLLHEDEVWTPLVFMGASKVYFSDRYFYMHYVREGSITRNRDKTKNAHDLIQICTILEAHYNQFPANDITYLLDRMAMLYMHATNIGCLYRGKSVVKTFPKKYAQKTITRSKAILYFVSPMLYCKFNHLLKIHPRDLLRSIYEKAPWPIKNFVYCHKGVLQIKTHIETKRRLAEAYSDFCNVNQMLSIENVGIWYRSFRRFLLAQPFEKEVAIEFFSNAIKPIKEQPIQDKEPILICIVKNDLYRMQKLVAHYRSLGITHFAILDNDSADGTREFLMQQNDVHVFFTDTPYTTNRREAWVNRLVAHYGFDRWYINVDSDELLTYLRCETYSISDVIEWAEHNSYDRLRAIMVDMYSQQNVFGADNAFDPYDQFCFFDSNTYHNESLVISEITKGGPRGRVFHQSPWLTKFPIFCFRKGDIQGKSHYSFPYASNQHKNCYLALLHYKFLPADYLKYQRIAEKGNFSNDSIQYRAYMKVFERNRDTRFMYDGSVKYEDPRSLQSVNLLSEIFK